MSQAVTDSRDGVVAEARSPRPTIRIQDNFLARSERRLLDRACRALPAWVQPDHLTALGVVGALITAVGYVLANLSTGFFWLASLGLVVNWFGDSLDGSLARYRKKERPKYGFFLDHSVDAISSLLITLGLGFSPYVGMDAALFSLIGYLCVGIYVLLAHQVSGEFRLSFLGCGPTEMRLIIIAFNATMFWVGALTIAPWGHVVSVHGLSVGGLGLLLIVVFVVNVLRTAAKLRT